MKSRQISLTQIKSTKGSITQTNNQTAIESNQCITQALKQPDKPNQSTNQSNKLKGNVDDMKIHRNNINI